MDRLEIVPATLAVAEKEGAYVPSSQEHLLPCLDDYDRYLVFFSGGKDSIACVLSLLERGVPRSRIELHHHLVDGNEGSTLMDWPVTKAYCEAFARAFGLDISMSWREGGIEREMLRQDAPTAPSWVPVSLPGSVPGQTHVAVGGAGPKNTRRKFPQVSADLRVRWCSAYAKIGVGDAYITNDPKFRQGKTCVVTGERAEESPSRARYKVFEEHRADNRDGRRVARWVDHFRPVHAMKTSEVWDMLKRWRVAPHPAYRLGWGRTSCMKCIFGSPAQWATIKLIDPSGFRVIGDYEREFGVTIHRSLSVDQQAALGVPYAVRAEDVAAAMATEYLEPILVDDWKLPLGAFGESCGPS